MVVWELSLDREVESGRGSPTVALAFSPDGRWIAQGRADRHVALIDANTGKEQLAVEVKAVPASLAFAEDKLAVGLERGAVLLEVPGLREIGPLAGPNEPVRTLSFSPDGERLAAGSEDGQGYVWLVSSRRLTHVLPLESGDVTLVRFVDDEHLVAAGSDRSVRALTLSK
jgi:WD40 repeat protein